MTDSAPTKTTYRVADLSQNSRTTFDLRPSRRQTDTIAKEMNLLGLRKLSFQGALYPHGKSDWELKARLGASVSQPCVVTLASVSTRIDVPIERRFLSQVPDYGDEEEVEMPDDENAEMLGPEIDLMEVLHEALALHLPQFPRADEAELGEVAFTEPGKQALTDDDVRPFAGLAALREQLTPKDDE